MAGLIRQSRQPQFISSSYFLRFRFDAGTYALVGRERLEDREVLRIEYTRRSCFPTPKGGQAGGTDEGGTGRRSRTSGYEARKSRGS